MKKLLSLFTFISFCVGSSWAQTTTTIGTGTTPSSNFGPINRVTASSPDDNSKYNYLYKTSELSNAGIPAGVLITKLGWYKQNASSTLGNAKFSIWMKNSSATDQPASITWGDVKIGATLKYTSTTQQISDPAGWIEFTLSSPFIYTGGSIEIGSDWDISAVIGNPTTSNFYWSNTGSLGFNATIGWADMADNFDAAILTNVVYGGTWRPNIQITYITQGPPTITNLGSNSGCAGTSLTIYGTNFFSATAVTVGGTAATIIGNNDTTLTVTLGNGTTGQVVVASPNGTASSTGNFTVLTAPAPSGNIISNSPQCSGTGITFTKGSCPTGTCYWVSSPIGTETTNSSATYITPSAIGDYFVWVRAYNGTCWSSAVSDTGSIFAVPTAPLVGSIIQPSCIVPTGSVYLWGLPPTGNWTLTRMPGSVTSSGSGNYITISGLMPGVYTYTVNIAPSCTSPISSNVPIYTTTSQPAPTIGTITQPTCTTATGSVILWGLPTNGLWTLTRSPGNIVSTGNTANTTITGLTPGTYTFIVTDTLGCTSVPSANVVINPQPTIPPTPVISLNGSTLHSNASFGNQWYYQSGLINGADRRASSRERVSSHV